MKLSDLVTYRSKVDKLSTNELSKFVHSQVDKIVNDLRTDNPGLDQEQHDIELIRDNLFELLNNFNESLHVFQDHLQQLVREQEVPYIQQSYAQYDEMSTDSPGYILDRHLFHTLIYRENIKELFGSRVSKYGDWKYAGMFIRPLTGEFVDLMINCDPLYIADEHRELLNPVKKLWSEDFQNRLRYQLISESDDIIFKNIPRNQLGFVVAMNFFNYRPLDVIRRYLLEILEILRPGGVFMFTYNNCDLPGSVKNVEKSMYCYTPGRLVQTMVESLGFEIIDSVDFTDTNVSWLEIKKPGSIKSLRGGQELAKIIKTPTDII